MRTLGVVPALATVALALIVPDIGHAQGSFLDKGRDLLRGAGIGSGSPATLAEDEIAKGLREALRVGVERVVGSIGIKDGFNRRSDIHIPLPGTLRRVQRTLESVGMSDLADDLELRLNRAVEASVPKARKLFGNAIAAMTIDDAKRILEGPNDAATQYFKGRMSRPLANEMKPIVEGELARAGAVRAYDAMISQYRSIPFMPDVKADLIQHVLDKAIGGLFLYVGREEAAIRENPAKRTTALLKKVFGAK